MYSRTRSVDAPPAGATGTDAQCRGVATRAPVPAAVARVRR